MHRATRWHARIGRITAHIGSRFKLTADPIDLAFPLLPFFYEGPKLCHFSLRCAGERRVWTRVFGALLCYIGKKWTSSTTSLPSPTLFCGNNNAHPSKPTLSMRGVKVCHTYLGPKPTPLLMVALSGSRINRDATLSTTDGPGLAFCVRVCVCVSGTANGSLLLRDELR